MCPPQSDLATHCEHRLKAQPPPYKPTPSLTTLAKARGCRSTHCLFSIPKWVVVCRLINILPLVGVCISISSNSIPEDNQAAILYPRPTLRHGVLTVPLLSWACSWAIVPLQQVKIMFRKTCVFPSYSFHQLIHLSTVWHTAPNTSHQAPLQRNAQNLTCPLPLDTPALVEAARRSRTCARPSRVPTTQRRSQLSRFVYPRSVHQFYMFLNLLFIVNSHVNCNIHPAHCSTCWYKLAV